MSASPLPVAVIGAGPVGLAAAAHLLSKGEQPVVCALTGNEEGARNVQLVLPEAGVCNTSGCCTADSDDFIPLASLPAGACCGAEAPVVVTASVSAPRPSSDRD